MEYIIKYTGDILSLGYPTELLDAQFAIMELEPDQAERLLEHSQVTCYEPERSLSCMADRAMEVSCIPPVQRGTGLGLTGKGVFIGLVDSGMDLSHPEFLGEDGISRVTAFWDMGAREGTPPPGFLHGAAYSGEAIAAGQVPALQDTGHGTAVAAIAAGRSGVAPAASIAAVKLSSARTTDVMRAVKYLLDRAEERGMPCVVNLSYGTNCGSHQGQTLFESYIDQSAQRGRSVIVCAISGCRWTTACPPTTASSRRPGSSWRARRGPWTACGGCAVRESGCPTASLTSGCPPWRRSATAPPSSSRSRI